MIVADQVRPCPVCGLSLPRLLWSPAHSPGRVSRCVNCGMVYVAAVTNPRSIIEDGGVFHDQPAELLAGKDLGMLDGCWEWGDLAMKQKETRAIKINVRQALAKLPRKTGRLLDFGCGGGFFLAEVKALGWEIFGLEPLPGHAVHARALTGGTIVTDTLRDDTFEPAFFDCVTAFQVFEHLPEPATDLARLFRMTKPGGTILIEVPNIDTWGVRLLRGRHRHFVPDHLNFFSAATLSRLLRQAGFEVAETYRPSRTMSLEYLVEHWGRRVLSESLSRQATLAISKLPAQQWLLRLNLGDILAVVARKPK